MKEDFQPFPVGTIHNPLIADGSAMPKYLSVQISFPSRLNAMAIDPSQIVKNRNMIYTPGEVVISVDICREVIVNIVTPCEEKKLYQAETNERKSLISHAFGLMAHALNFKECLYIEVDEKNIVPHCGLGSSSALIAAVASAINELYGRPIDPPSLVKYLAQNHGEEIEGFPLVLMPVQCIGGSAASGLFEASVIILAGESQVIASCKLDEEQDIVIGLPLELKLIDAQVAMQAEIQALPKFELTGVTYSREIAYRMLHHCIPNIIVNNIKPLGQLVFDYRFKMGSIENCSFLYPELPVIGSKLSILMQNDIVDLLSLSSVGPAFFAITQNRSKCVEVFESAGLNPLIAKPFNSKYTVISQI